MFDISYFITLYLFYFSCPTINDNDSILICLTTNDSVSILVVLQYIIMTESNYGRRSDVVV